MAYNRQARDPVQHHASTLAAKVTGTEPGRKHLAVHARQLVIQQNFHILRDHRCPLLRSLEQTYRRAVDNHVDRNPEMGAQVLIIAAWY